MLCRGGGLRVGGAHGPPQCGEKFARRGQFHHCPACYMKAYWPIFETGSICKNVADKSFRYGHAFYSAPETMAVDAGARRRSGHWVWLLLKAANKREVSVRVRYEGPVGFREHLVTKFPGARAEVEAMGDAV